MNVVPCSPSNPFKEVSYGSLCINCRYLVAGTLHYREPDEPTPAAASSFRIGRRNCPVRPHFDTRSACNMFERGDIKIYLLRAPRIDHETNWHLSGLMIGSKRQVNREANTGESGCSGVEKAHEETRGSIQRVS